MTLIKAALPLFIIPFLAVAGCAQSGTGADGGQINEPPKQGNSFDGNPLKRVFPDFPLWNPQPPQQPQANDAPNTHEMHSSNGDHLFDEPVHVGPGDTFDRGL